MFYFYCLWVCFALMEIESKDNLNINKMIKKVKNVIYTISGVAYVTKICSRGHFLLIRVCIHQNVCLCK